MEPMAISDLLVDDLVALSPLTSTMLGLPGRDDRWDDLSPDGIEARIEVLTAAAEKMREHLDHPDHWERLAAHVVGRYADERVAEFEAEDHVYDLSHMASSFQQIREIFDVMPTDSSEAWEAVIARLRTIGTAFDGYRESLRLGMERNQTESVRSVRAVIAQAAELAGERSSYNSLIESARSEGFSRLVDPLIAAVDSARSEVARFAQFIETEYLPCASSGDGVGKDRYERCARRFLGSRIDLSDTYRWGWEEIARLTEEMRDVAEVIAPGRDLDEVTRLLEESPAVDGTDAFSAFIEGIERTALAELGDTHFDVPDEIRTIGVNFAPPGGALGAYYLGPSEDFSRQGAIWYAFGDKTRFPLCQEVSTAFHEGFPGHHLQIGTAMAMSDRLSRAHRLLIWHPGYGEGWALYAERLMGELGYFERPEYLYGMLVSQVFRAARVVVDIGLHLGLEIPETASIGGGRRWDFDTGVDFMETVGMQTRSYAESEVKRYLGWPGQAISYKVGERLILGLREQFRQTFPGSDLKEFHRRVLTNGDMGLDLLVDVVLERDGW